MEQQTGSKLRKRYVKAVYCHPAYLTSMQSTSCRMPGWMKHKLELRLQGEISITSEMQMTPPRSKDSKLQPLCLAGPHVGSRFSPGVKGERSWCWQSHDHRERRLASSPFWGPHLVVGGKQEDARKPAASPLGPPAQEALAPAPPACTRLLGSCDLCAFLLSFSFLWMKK